MSTGCWASSDAARLSARMDMTSAASPARPPTTAVTVPTRDISSLNPKVPIQFALCPSKPSISVVVDPTAKCLRAMACSASETMTGWPIATRTTTSWEGTAKNGRWITSAGTPFACGPHHLMPMTERRNSELEHQRALEDPDSVLRDLAKIFHMNPGVMLWAMAKRLPVGRGEPGGEPFAYGLDGQSFEHELGPAAYPAVTELLRNKPKPGASSPIGRKKSKRATTRTRSKAP